MKKSILQKAGYGCLLGCLLSACMTTKDITYFQPVSPQMDDAVTQMQEQYVPKIKAGDILSITVSSLDRKASEMFNPVVEVANYTTQTIGTIAPQPVLGYTVDGSGNISLPMLGQIAVAGLTSKELSVQLTEKLQQYIESPMVTVRIANYMISVLGEVTRPAWYSIPNEQITLPEALALAGDLTIYGKRKNILIIRETDGVRSFARVDITRRDLFASPYYYLRSGDIVYVEASGGRLVTTDRIYQLAPIFINSLTLMVLIFTTFIK